MADVVRFDLAPAEAVRYFESKGMALSFSWQDVWGEEHARAFTVAKAMRLDILEDLRRGVDKAIRTGTTFDTFKKDLIPVLQEKGWWGKQVMTDPETGEDVEVQLGSESRLKLIFYTNIRTAYAAGQWERIQRVKAMRPYLYYSAVDDEKTRPQHAAWHGTVLPVDHPWWTTHFPPNGWNCRCSVQQLGPRDLTRRGLSVTDPPPSSPMVTRTRRRSDGTEEDIQVPAGIDMGWDHNVGMAHMRGLAPPPAEGEMFTVFNMPERAGGTGLPAALNRPADQVPLPPPTQVSESLVLPKGTDADTAAKAFFDEFGAAPGRPAVFIDAIGERLVIDDALFTDVHGDSKLADSERRQYIRLVALAVKEPDEIWWVWEYSQALARHMLRRRYFKRLEVGGKMRSGIVAFDVGADGWRGVTAFASGKRTYIEKQRGGTLAYRRKQ